MLLYRNFLWKAALLFLLQAHRSWAAGLNQGAAEFRQLTFPSPCSRCDVSNDVTPCSGGHDTTSSPSSSLSPSPSPSIARTDAVSVAEEEDGHDIASHFAAHLPRNVTDAYHDTLYPVGEANPALVDESRPRGDAADATGSSAAQLTDERPPTTTEREGTSPESVFGPFQPVGPDLSTLNGRDGKGDGQEERQWREHHYGSRHPLFSAGALILELGQVISPGKRKRRPSSSAESNANTSPGSKSDKAWRSQARGKMLFSPTADVSQTPFSPPAILIKQPETRPISQEQLVAEVKGIYAGLVMVEAKCIEIDNAQASSSEKLNNEHWQALIALHRTLLHEHHDFFLVSQHPSASPALRRLASKYAMPARMWRHGIHSFLELLRHRLPESSEHMCTFIYQAYSLIAVLYETVPVFEDIWTECLGDLGRYRLVIEDDNIRDRQVWTSVSRYWYAYTSDRNPTSGRLYHHLAVLSRPDAVRQLFYYAKSLSAPNPCLFSRESIMTIFDPVLERTPTPRPLPADVAFVRAHTVLVRGIDSSFNEYRQDFLAQLDSHVASRKKMWLQEGFLVAIASLCSMTGYGAEGNPFVMAMTRLADDSGHDNVGYAESSNEDDLAAKADGPPTRDEAMSRAAIDLAMQTTEIVWNRAKDPNILPYSHVILVFIDHLARHPAAMEFVQDIFPWDLLAQLLNHLVSLPEADGWADRELFPPPSSGHQPLPEDFAMRGLPWADDYFPAGWFSERDTDYESYDEMVCPVVDYDDSRISRILRLGYGLARLTDRLFYDPETIVFSAAPHRAGDMDLDEPSPTSVVVGDKLLSSDIDAMDVDAPDQISAGNAGGPSDDSKVKRRRDLTPSPAALLSMRGSGIIQPSTDSAPEQHRTRNAIEPPDASEMPPPMSLNNSSSSSVASAQSNAAHFSCEVCATVFRRKCDLNKHSLAHTKPIACMVDGCEYRCATPRDLRRHQAANHPGMVEKESFTCKVPGCGKTYERKDNLKRHYKVHFGT